MPVASGTSTGSGFGFSTAEAEDCHDCRRAKNSAEHKTERGPEDVGQTSTGNTAPFVDFTAMAFRQIVISIVVIAVITTGRLLTTAGKVSVATVIAWLAAIIAGVASATSITSGTVINPATSVITSIVVRGRLSSAVEPLASTIRRTMALFTMCETFATNATGVFECDTKTTWLVTGSSGWALRARGSFEVNGTSDLVSPAQSG